MRGKHKSDNMAAYEWARRSRFPAFNVVVLEKGLMTSMTKSLLAAAAFMLLTSVSSFGGRNPELHHEGVDAFAA